MNIQMQHVCWLSEDYCAEFRGYDESTRTSYRGWIKKAPKPGVYMSSEVFTSEQELDKFFDDWDCADNPPSLRLRPKWLSP